jgi:CRP/FNR family transcriptional regulator, cyclic AMP receptor protein
VNSGQFLFQQGSPHRSSFLVETGLVRTYYAADSGREITLAYWSAGDLVGGPNFLGGDPHIWNGVVLKPGRVLAIRDADLQRLSDKDAAILRWLADILAFKLNWLSVLFQIHATESVRERLAKLLVILCEIYGDVGDTGIVIRHTISQSELATLVGASRQWTNRTLAALREEGLVDMPTRQLRILDIDRLRLLGSPPGRLRAV